MEKKTRLTEAVSSDITSTVSFFYRRALCRQNRTPLRSNQACHFTVAQSGKHPVLAPWPSLCRLLLTPPQSTSPNIIPFTLSDRFSVIAFRRVCISLALTQHCRTREFNSLPVNATPCIRLPQTISWQVLHQSRSSIMATWCLLTVNTAQISTVTVCRPDRLCKCFGYAQTI
jgi:hypothetical protein